MNIELPDVQIPFLIIEHPTGVTFSGQVRGMMCDHIQVEGFVIPLSGYEWQALEGLSCPNPCTQMGLDEEVLEALRKAWPKAHSDSYGHEHGLHIELDEERAGLGTEAWFPVKLMQKVKPRPHSWEAESSWLDGKRGFLLMYDNCD